MRRELVSNVVDLIDPVVRSAGEVLADPGTAWRLPVADPDPDPGRAWTWVTTRFASTPLCLELPSDPLFPALGRGDVVLFRGGAVRSFATDWTVTEPPRATDDPEYCATGVFHGAVTFGPLLDEVLAPPPLIVARRHRLTEDLVDSLGRVEPPAHRMGAAMSDALARALVLHALTEAPPPWAADGRLHPALAALTDLSCALADLPSNLALAESCRLPERTFMRRFRVATDTTPVRLARWFRLAAFRSGHASVTALDAGYSDERALGRAITRDSVLGFVRDVRTRGRR